MIDGIINTSGHGSILNGTYYQYEGPMVDFTHMGHELTNKWVGFVVHGL